LELNRSRKKKEKNIKKEKKASFTGLESLTIGVNV
jgi:hypothetical protein